MTRRATTLSNEDEIYPAYEGSGVRKETCPECHQKCELCEASRMNCREEGCGLPYLGGGRYRCAKGQAEKGRKCSICDGSGEVNVKWEILR